MPPDGDASEKLIDTALPTRGKVRWTAGRKAAVVVGIRQGVITAYEAGERYMLSREELAMWDQAFMREGIPGLLVKNQPDDRYVGRFRRRR
jgi:hypothetical protein